MGEQQPQRQAVVDTGRERLDRHPGDSQIFDTGHTYAYTFEVPGEYAYFCRPHRSLGMTGSFTVTE
ncbi:plastocyanin/azurin family copper-binding protein [Haloarcula regularis]|uniref:plastocyanin/azurin family copper-binding protein n=1 Tax=Haloarcula regularis TaxID=3033392 RepID=UPI003204B511